MPRTTSTSTIARHTKIDANDLDRLRRELTRPLPHPDPAALEDDAAAVAGWVLHHLATLAEQPVLRPASRPQMEALLRQPPPEEGSAVEQVLAEFGAKVAPFAVRTNHPRFLAFIPGAPTVPSLLGDWLCAGTNFFCGVWLEAPGPTEVELLVLDWFKQFLGYPPTAHGILTSGGSEANLTALVVARERLSFDERARAILYVTEHRHWSTDRAARVIGLHPDQICPVPADAEFRLHAQTLGECLARDRAAGRLPWAVVANAGATNTGTVDPLNALADVCAEQKLWLHVDAAYGWPAVLTDDGRAALAGIERADSVTLDPHKWFGQTFEAGCVLVREGRRLGETFALRPDYMKDVEPGEDEVNFADCGLALTRRFRALKIWFSLKVLGVNWFRTLVQRCCDLADYAEALLKGEGVFEILSPRHLSIVGFRYVPPAWAASADRAAELDRLNLTLLDELRATGRAFLSSTRLHGKIALRFCFVNWRTSAADLEEIIRLLVEIGARINPPEAS